MSRIRQRPIKVSKANDWDKKVIALTEKGFYSEAIARNTGLSVYQVRYRQAQFKLRPNDFRRGYSTYALSILKRIDKSLGTATWLQRQIEAHLRHNRKARKAVRV
jgi:hypothetical protein